MANGNITVAVTILFTVNLIILLFSGVLGVSTIGDFVVYQMIPEEDFDTGRIDEIDSGFDEGFNKDATTDTDVGQLFSLIDGLKKVFSVIITILGLGFALLAMLIALDAPIALSIILGLPVAIGFYVSILGAVRGKDL